MTQGQSLLSEVKNGVCDADEEWYYADAGRLGWEGLRKFMRITCEDQWPLEDFLYGDEETPERSCAFYSTSDRQGDNWGSGPICLVGTLSCKYQKSSWQCPVGKTCGKEVSSCL